MSLFQPTFITPDARSGLGGGVVDVADGLAVSWHINGASAMVAFQIDVYENTAESAAQYSTGRISDGCPAYGTSSAGETLFFSYTIPAAALSALSNGNEYKLLITQWWSASESVAQSSASVFVTRAKPTLAVSPVGSSGVVDTRYYTFAGEYSQAQGDILNWFRWRLALASQTAALDAGTSDALLYDSGNISGTMDLSMYYDGLFSGTEYAVRLTAQTENGVEADTGWVPFSVAYDTPEIAGQLAASCAKGTDAVLVEWSGVAYIPGRAAGGWSVSDDGLLTLLAGGSVTWDAVNDAPMSFAAPWSVVYRGTLAGDAALFTVGQTDGDLALSWSGGTLSLVKNGSVIASRDGVAAGTVVTVILTPTTLYLRLGYLSGGLYPSDTLYPADDLYPAADTVETAETVSFALSYTQGAVTGVTLGGAQVCDYIEVIKGTPSDATVTAAWAEGSYAPGLSETDWMVADFSDGLNAGNLNIGGDTIEGYALYRRQGDAGVLVHVADVGESVGAIYDYGAVSQGGPYTYFLFPLGTETYIAAGLVSGEASPCFWSWTLMECAATGNGSIFTVLAEYRFRYNVSTGAMSNNNAPNVLKNFTRYPTVQLAPQNYKGGTLTALIGRVDWESGVPRYVDGISLRDAIFALPLSQNALFLKNRKGDLIRVRVSEAVTMQTGDATKEQTQTMALAWVETGSAEGVSLYALGSAAANSSWSGGGSGGGGGGGSGTEYDTSDATATAGDITASKTAYVASGKVTGTLQNLDATGY